MILDRDIKIKYDSNWEDILILLRVLSSVRMMETCSALPVDLIVSLSYGILDKGNALEIMVEMKKCWNLDFFTKIQFGAFNLHQLLKLAFQVAVMARYSILIL